MKKGNAQAKESEKQGHELKLFSAEQFHHGNAQLSGIFREIYVSHTLNANSKFETYVTVNGQVKAYLQTWLVRIDDRCVLGHFCAL